MFKLSFRLIILPAALALGLTHNAQAQSKPPVKIAVIMPLSGGGAFDGEDGVRAAKAMAEVYNRKGGILGGRKIEILTYDDKSSPEEGVSATKRAIQEDHVDALATSLNSSVVLAEKEVSRNTILHMVAAPQHPNVTQEGHKWLFRLNETNATRAKRFGKFICERMGLKSLSLITINDDYGRAEVAAYQPTFESCGMKVVGNEFFERTDTDFTVQLTKIKSQRADAVYVIASSTSQGATIYRQLKQLGYPGKIIAAGGNMNPKLVELSGPALEGVYSVVMYTDAMDNPQSKEFVRVYRTLFKEPISHVGGLTAECIEIAVEAMEKAGSSTDYDKISTIIRSTTWHTIRGTVTFDDIGQALANNIIVQVKGGAIVPVNY